MNYLLFFASILDPRYKLEFVEYSVNQMYGDLLGSRMFINLKAELSTLFDEYLSLHGSSASDSVGSQSSQPVPEGERHVPGTTMSLIKARFKKYKLESGGIGSKKTELDIYLAEDIVEDEGKFDILRWWKLNSERFPILSRMARDILAVPVSTVASESTFSTGGHVLDVFRSSLTPKIVEALICTQDWLRIHKQPVSIKENIEELEAIEKGYTYSLLFDISFFLFSLELNGCPF